MYRLKNKCPFYFLLFTFCFLLIITCTTSPQTGTLSGTINLEGQTDHSNITIGIYELAMLDPDIVEANQKWPHIGVIINQMTEFDHRFGTLVKTGDTDASGSFEITNIPTGIYNVIAIKDSFGFRYIYNVQINNGSNNLEVKSISHFPSPISQGEKTPQTYIKADITLFPATHITYDITSPTTFLSYHHYIIEQDIIVDDELTIKSGAVVRLNQGKDITSYGTFNAVGEYENFIWFTKNDGFSEDLYSIEPDSNYIWDKVTLEPYSQAQVQWCRFDWANIGLLNHVNGFEISDCIFRESNCGFKAEDVDSTFCSNLLCRDILNESEAAIYFYQVANGLIEKNVMHDCENGMIIKDESSPEVNNNYISNCNNGVDISHGSSSDIHNNEISCFDYSIYIAHYSDSIIEKNNFNSKIGIRIYNFGDRQSEIHNNNLNCSKYAIELKADYCTPIYYNINAENNYYYTNNENEIEKILYDKYDGNQYIEGEVFYIPFLTQEYPYAGIHG